MENKDFNPTESLQVINSMINTAKNKLADDGFLLIFWGWLVMACALIHYISLKMNIDYGFIVWITLMPAGGIFSGVYGYRQGKKKSVKTYVDTYIGYLWIAIGISMFITLAFIGMHGIKITYFFLMMLYGVATMVSGGILNFRPLIIGSLVSFACAIISVFLNDIDQLLIISLALLGSFVIPAHLLRSKFRSQNV